MIFVLESSVRSKNVNEMGERQLCIENTRSLLCATTASVEMEVDFAVHWLLYCTEIHLEQVDI